MIAYCQCPYETAREADPRGVLLCAVCSLPKSAASFGDEVLNEEGCMAALQFGPTQLKLFRSLVNAGRIPAISFSPRVKRFHLRTILTKYKQTLAAFLLFVATSCDAADWNGFVRAIHLTESGGKDGAILSDGGRALGPLAIHKAYWTDARQPGSYGDVTNLAYATATMRAYLQRYAPAALAAGESANRWQECARIHNGGPNGGSRRSTLVFWKKVEAKL